MRKSSKCFLLACLVLLVLVRVRAAAAATPAPVIFDTDIGDDIDDAYALALLLKSPEVQILGVTTAFGDTHMRARLVTHLLQATGNQAIPVYEGPATVRPKPLTQALWAGQSPDTPYPDAIQFMLDTIRAQPGKITLIAVAPFTNVGALIARDPATFRKLKRVVLMGGSVYRGYGAKPNPQPAAEWNILCDIPGAQALFTSDVPLYVMPLDSTQIPLDAARKATLFSRATPMTDALKELTREWGPSPAATPTLYDAVAAAYAINPEVCPTTPLRIEVDARGFTRVVEGKPNANVCLQSSAEDFFAFYLPRVMR